MESMDHSIQLSWTLGFSSKLVISSPLQALSFAVCLVLVETIQFLLHSWNCSSLTENNRTCESPYTQDYCIKSPTILNPPPLLSHLFFCHFFHKPGVDGTLTHYGMAELFPSRFSKFESNPTLLPFPVLVPRLITRCRYPPRYDSPSKESG
ncbi:hypothetical protein BP00DRAFT_49866 [Aspergillus indologenus CBS 114.80]|uniref:Uncharacterized protein n=1 Tax=Aspergillus indologenus CBS 114.80 TaxID=1450541 RepID=A0A2V5HSA8_9EURO|nr:hypothetical protein BP00DRAFT_49866 [Aspergillus indologenus CBS 114.80]